MMSEPANHRAGFVSILGVPNVGKSTLLNAMLGERLSIATSKAQTTRHRVMGILNGDDYQIVCSDTPGVLRGPQYKLQEGMMGAVRSAVIDADAILLVVDVFQEEALPDEKMLRQLSTSPTPVLVLLNKIDLLDDAVTPRAAERRAEYGSPEQLQQQWRERFPAATVLPVCAKRGEGVDDVLRHLRSLMPEHPPFYDKSDDAMSVLPERFFASEMLREAIFEHYQQEVPYSCECRIEAFKESEEIIRIRADIFVEHDSQKGIVIGAKGSALKRVGIKARRRMEGFFHKKIHLETRVKVKPNWRQDKFALQEFGYMQ